MIPEGRFMRSHFQPRALLAAAALACLPGACAAVEAGGKREAARLASDAPEALDRAFEHYQRGCLLFEQDMPREALRAFDEAIALAGSYPRASYMRGVAQLRLGMHEDAARSARQALEASPSFTEAHNLLGLALGDAGDFDGAARAFRTVLRDRTFPTPEVAHFNLGRIARLGADCEVAEAELKRAIELNPSFGKAWYLLGECRRDRRDLAAARAALERAVELLPDACEPSMALARTCLDAGDAACARARLQAILLHCPPTPLAPHARKLAREIAAAPGGAQP